MNKGEIVLTLLDRATMYFTFVIIASIMIALIIGALYFKAYTKHKSEKNNRSEKQG